MLMKIALALLGLLVLLGVLAVAGGRLGWWQGQPPSDLGVKDGRLKAPSRTPNSVSSQALLHPGHPMQQAAMILPLALNGDAAATLARLRQVIEAMPGAQVVDQRPDYLYARFRSRLMGYVDDAEFWADPAEGVIQVRSASRLGRKDFDVNRQRIEALRVALAAAR